MDKRKIAGLGVAGAGLFSVAGIRSAAAQDTAASGNGGTSDASASGGALDIGDLNTGGNTGNAVAAGDIGDGAVAIDGGDLSSSTSLTISSDGGTAISDASGGDDNFAFVS
jgi:hypothetical protein